MTRSLLARYVCPLGLLGLLLLAVPAQARIRTTKAYLQRRALAQKHALKNFTRHVKQSIGGMWSGYERIALQGYKPKTLQVIEKEDKTVFYLGIELRPVYPRLKGHRNLNRMAVQRVTVRHDVDGKPRARTKIVAATWHNAAYAKFFSEHETPTLTRLFNAWKKAADRK